MSLRKHIYLSTFLKKDRDTSIDSPNDATHFENIVSTMRYLEFTDHQIDEIWHLLAALLHLGNISFCEILKESTDASKVKDTHRSELRYASNLLGVRFRLHCSELSRCCKYP